MMTREIFKQGPEVRKRCFFNDGPESVFEWWKRENKAFTDSLGGLETLKYTLRVPKWKGETVEHTFHQ